MLNGKQARFGELDALRGLAALLVVIFHFTTRAQNNGAPLFSFEFGHFGVQLFFCISGFVIYWTLARSKTLVDFAVSRFSRLYPAYWAAIAILVGVDAIGYGIRPWLGGYAVNATMLQHFAGWKDVDTVYWTLAVELMFYVWMAVFFAAGLLRQVVPIAASWLGVSIACGLLTRFMPVGEPWQTLLMAEHIPYFAAGMMFYLIKKNGWTKESVSVIALAWLAACANWEWVGAAVAGIVFAIFALAVSGGLRWLVNPATVWLGTISYSLYLTHRAWGGLVTDAVLNAGGSRWLAFAAAIASAIGLASLLTLAVERPALAAIRKWYARRKVTAATVPEAS